MIFFSILCRFFLLLFSIDVQCAVGAINEDFTVLRAIFSQIGCATPLCQSSTSNTCVALGDASELDDGIGCFMYLPGMKKVNHVRLNMAQNLAGTLPTLLGRLTELTLLHIIFNKNIVGTIPTEVGLLTKLKDLRFHRNNLSGTIPSEIMALPRLATLYLYENQLVGSVPPLDSSFLSVCALQREQMPGNCLDTSTCPTVCTCQREGALNCPEPTTTTMTTTTTMMMMTTTTSILTTPPVMKTTTPRTTRLPTISTIPSNTPMQAFIPNSITSLELSSFYLSPSSFVSSYWWIFVIASGVLICVVICIVFYVRKRRKQAASNADIPLESNDGQYQAIPLSNAVSNDDDYMRGELHLTLDNAEYSSARMVAEKTPGINNFVDGDAL